jgi:hypothetical protein
MGEHRNVSQKTYSSDRFEKVVPGGGRREVVRRENGNGEELLPNEKTCCGTGGNEADLEDSWIGDSKISTKMEIGLLTGLSHGAIFRVADGRGTCLSWFPRA